MMVCLEASGSMSSACHAIPAALPSTRRAPAKFAHAARARNDVTGLRVIHQGTLKFPILIVIEIFQNKARKQPSLNEAEH